MERFAALFVHTAFPAAYRGWPRQTEAAAGCYERKSPRLAAMGNGGLWLVLCPDLFCSCLCAGLAHGRNLADYDHLRLASGPSVRAMGQRTFRETLYTGQNPLARTGLVPDHSGGGGTASGRARTAAGPGSSAAGHYSCADCLICLSAGEPQNDGAVWRQAGCVPANPRHDPGQSSFLADRWSVWPGRQRVPLFFTSGTIPSRCVILGNCGDSAFFPGYRYGPEQHGRTCCG
ncbi:hypothetical protein D3C75_828480 [compost metagenome]